MLLVRSIITLLCAVGFYASVFMLRKSLRAEQGLLTEPSVVQTPRAKLFAGIPNALVGTVYYTAVAVIVWVAQSPTLLLAACAASLAAAGTSAYLAYSLLFVTKRSCPYCWTAHTVNWALAAILPWLLGLR